MSSLVYLNGQWLERERATVSIEDRGFLFADGVYEVVRYYNARPIAMAEHIQRLRQSLAALRIQLPADHPGLDQISDELVRRNATPDAAVYWQITRGAATPRKHTFPPPGTPPTVLVMAYPAPAFDAAMAVPQLQAITRPDIRWHHCEIKAVSLLANILDSQAAADAGCQEAILIRDDCGSKIVTEGTSRSIFIAQRDGSLLTYPLDGRILDSITRRIVLKLAREDGISIHEQRFGPERLADAPEVIAVGTTTEVAAIIRIDGKTVGGAGGGAAGPIATRLFKLFRQYVADHCCIEDAATRR